MLPRFRLRSTQPAMPEIGREIVDGNGFLRIGRHFAHEYRALHRLFMAHYEDMGGREWASCRHLFAEALVPEAVVDGHAGLAESFERGQRPTARLKSEMSKIHTPYTRCLDLEVCGAASFTVYSDHCCGYGCACEPAYQRVVASAEGDRGPRACLGVDRKDFEERLRPAVAAAEDLAVELVRQDRYFKVFKKIPKAATFVFGEIFHRLRRARYGRMPALDELHERPQWVHGDARPETCRDRFDVFAQIGADVAHIARGAFAGAHVVDAQNAVGNFCFFDDRVGCEDEQRFGDSGIDSGGVELERNARNGAGKRRDAPAEHGAIVVRPCRDESPRGGGGRTVVASREGDI